MTKTGWTLIGLVLAGLLAMPGSRVAAQKLHEKEEIHKSFTLSAERDRQLVLDNINGGINIVGYDGNTIELSASKEIEAESAEKVEEAKRDVTLEIKEEPNKLVLYVDAPWRTHDGINYRGWHYYGYDVLYDFELKVPRKMSLYLTTVNHGKVFVHGVEGDFEVHNVNGGIEMTDIDGPAKVITVNGPVHVTFTKNPEGDCKFKTVNGKVEVSLREGLNANLDFKTFNGKVYSDFDVTALPPKPMSVESRSGRRTVYRRGDSYAVRVGKGGPDFSFDTLNGSIYVLKAE